MASKREEKLKSPRPSSSTRAASKPHAFNLRSIHEAIPRASSSHSSRKLPEATQKPRSSLVQVSSLPLDVLVRCFLKLDSIFQILSCSAVCRVWREASLFDVLWKEIYIRWHLDDQLPSGFESWREAFIRRFSKGRLLVFEREVKRAQEAGLLQRHQNDFLDFRPGVSFQTFAEDLQLEFYMRINNSQQFRLKGRQVVVLPSSCILHCPFNCMKRKMKLSFLTSVEVMVSSGRLAKSYPVSQLKLQKNTHWRINGNSSTPVRLIQHGETPATNLIVGTLLESLDNESIRDEEVVFIKVALHLAEVISKFLASRLATHRIVRDPDPTYGLYGYHASVELHTFDKLLWSRNFHMLFWNQRESVQGETAVLLLIPLFEVVSSKVCLPWRSEAFSGVTENSLLATITLWDTRSERVWQAVDIFELKPVTVPCVEYGLPEFEGCQFEATISDTRRGMSVSIKCSTPLYSNSDPMFAITDLRVSLTRSFLLSWFGVSNI